MADVEVGRVTIKVTPDTRGFRGQTEREVNAAVKGINPSVPVDSDTDFSDVKPEAAAAAKGASQKVKFDADTSGFKDLQVLAKQTYNIHKKTGALADKFNRASIIRQEQERLELAESIASVNARDNNSHLRSVKQLQVYSKETFRIQKRTAAVAEKALNIRQKGDADNLAAAHAIGRSVKKTSLLQFPNFGTGLNPQAYAVILGLITLFASPVLGFLTTALLALPGAIALVGAPIAALALGMDGLKYAAKQLEQPLKDMKLWLSAQAADTFTPIFARLIPAMKAVIQPLATVTKGVGAFADGILNAVVQGDGLERIQDSLFNIGTFFDNSAGGAERFTAGFTTLAHAFSDQLPDLSDWFNEQGTAFDEWVGEITANGQLDQAFQNLGTVLDTIIDQFTRLLGIAFDGFSGENGADLLVDSFELLGDVLANVLEFSNLIIASWDRLRQGSKFITSIGKLMSGDVFGAIHDFEQGIGVRPLDEITVDTEKATAELTMFAGHVEAISQNVNGSLTKIHGPGLGHNTNPALDAFLGTGGGPLGGGKDPVASVIDTTERDKAIAEHAQFIQTTADQVAGALSKDFGGGTLPTPDFSAYQAAWQGLVSVVDTATTKLAEAPSKLLTVSGQITSSFSGVGPVAITAFGEMVGAVKSGTNDAVGIMEGLGPRIIGPIELIAGQMYAQGLSIGTGLAKGITDSTPDAVAAAETMARLVSEASKTELGINSPSLEYEDQGKSIIEGLALGIHGQAYLAQQAIKEAVVPSSSTKSAIKDAYDGIAGVMAGDTRRLMESTPFTAANQQRLKELNKQTKELSLTLRFLNADLEASNAAGDVAIQQEIDRVKELQKRVNLEKKNLELHKEALGIAGKENDESNKSIDYLNQAISAGQDFATANANQFTSDLGIGGTGAISQGISEGISWLSGALGDFISGAGGGLGGPNIIVNSADDAFNTWQNQTNVQKKRYANR